MHHAPSPADACDAGAAAACDRSAPADDVSHAGAGRIVWLRANRRPGIVVAAVATLLLVVIVVAARPWQRPVGGLTWLAGGGVVVAGACCLTVISRPRIGLDGEGVAVHLRPARVDVVPLGAVECFFLGSRLEPPPPGDHSTGGERVRTLVMRIAERAVDHAQRPTLPVWGGWREGSVTFDGRWCEPLSVDLVRRLNRELAAAKRAAKARSVTDGEAT